MTDQEMQVAIAEAVGWTYEKRESWPKRRPKHYDYILQAPDQKIKVLPEYTVAHANPETERILGLKRVPDYQNSLDAMAIAEQTLSKEEQHAYGFELVNVMIEAMRADGCKSQADFDEHAQWVWHATARQRAQAFVRTIAARAEREAKV